jgi:hypothetical protein
MRFIPLLLYHGGKFADYRRNSGLGGSQNRYGRYGEEKNALHLSVSNTGLSSM